MMAIGFLGYVLPMGQMSLKKKAPLNSLKPTICWKFYRVNLFINKKSSL